MKKLCVVMLIIFASCSSSEEIQIQDAGQQNSSLSDAVVLKKDRSLNLQNAVLGTVPFFYGGARGLNVQNLKWSKPVNGENPGVDCELSLHEKKKTDSHFYKCVVKAGKLYVILSIEEKIIGNSRRMQRIFMDAKGVGYVQQWKSSLLRAGYASINKKGTSYLSKDRKTLADIVWVPRLNSATLRLSPK